MEKRSASKGFQDLPSRIKGSDVKPDNEIVQLTRNVPTTLVGTEVQRVLDARAKGRRYRSRNID